MSQAGCGRLNVPPFDEARVSMNTHLQRWYPELTTTHACESRDPCHSMLLLTYYTQVTLLQRLHSISGHGGCGNATADLVVGSSLSQCSLLLAAAGGGKRQAILGFLQ